MPDDIEDGVEVHFDAKNGFLELACEPAAFARYREIAREDLNGLGIPVGDVTEMNIVATSTYVARREARWKSGIARFIVPAMILAMWILAAVGAITLILKILG